MYRYKHTNLFFFFQDNIENVSYVWALCRDQSILDHRSAWRVLEFGIQNSSSWLWQVLITIMSSCSRILFVVSEHREEETFNIHWQCLRKCIYLWRWSNTNATQYSDDSVTTCKLSLFTGFKAILQYLVLSARHKMNSKLARHMCLKRACCARFSRYRWPHLEITLSWGNPGI